MEKLSARLSALAEKATPALFNGGSTARGIASVLKAGVEHQRPRADNWDRIDCDADAAFFHAVCENKDTIISALQEKDM